MANGMWTAVSGAVAQQRQVDTIANNLANTDTASFKKEMPTFKSYLTAEERNVAPTDLARGKIKDAQFYPLNTNDRSFVVNDGTYIDFRQGNIRVTNSPLDVAIDGPGFFEVSTPQGIRYTRHGSFKLTTDGQLVTAQGYPVLASEAGGLASALPAAAVQSSQGGLNPTQGGVGTEQPISNAELEARKIQLTGSANLTVTTQGEVYEGDRLVGQLAVVEFSQPATLRKAGQMVYENPNEQNQRLASSNTTLKQGAIEQSNVNPVEEITKLISANRMFEHDLKAIQAYSEIMGKAANDLGKY